MTDKSFLPVLMYHSVGEPVPEEREVGAELYDVQEEAFKRQMEWLRENAYSVITDLPVRDNAGNSVVLTFDDGESNNYSRVLPVLTGMGFKAFFFVIVKRVGHKGYMTWDELRELREAGMIIGSHGLSHEILTNLKDSQMEQELIASKKTIEQNLEFGVECLSIPRGFFNEKIKKIAFDIGYRKVFISGASNGLDEGCYPRIAVKGSWGLPRFIHALEGNVHLNEEVCDKTKSLLKFVFRESGYNFLRTLCIRIFK